MGYGNSRKESGSGKRSRVHKCLSKERLYLARISWKRADCSRQAVITERPPVQRREHVQLEYRMVVTETQDEGKGSSRLAFHLHHYVPVMESLGAGHTE